MSSSTFKPSIVDEAILKDTGNYRVLDISYGIGAAFNGGPTTSYFHKSVGGYHPAKLSIYQDLIEKQLYNFPSCIPVLNMLNAKYIITPPKQNGQAPGLQKNDGVLGNCWFVRGVAFKKGPAEIMQALTNFDTRDSALVDEKFKQLVNANPNTDSTSSIDMVFNDNDIIEYKSASKTAEFAVFSEVYYDGGWVATIDGKETPIIETNYVLRGIEVPAGNHKIVFEFKPASYYDSNKAAIGASAFIWILLIGAVLSCFRKPKELA